jgi:DNA (cytosine-5)-methyltransferase 1
MPVNNLTLGSLFDGSGGFPLGGILSGITPVWASEIEPFPIRVTTKRLPFMKHYGDVSTLSGGILEPVDVITFGSPCQDMSIAGKRAGLDGSRSNLFYEAVRIVKEMREKTDGKKPKYIVWENVPGAFSSNGGEDFRCVLESICGIREENVSVPLPSKWKPAGEILGDGYSVAWRVLDAQYWGVPQRRKRIYLVADLDGPCAGKILFESEGLSGYSASRFRAWQEAAGSSGDGAEKTGLCLNDQGGGFMDVGRDAAGTLRAESHGHPPLVFENHSQDSRYKGPLKTTQTVTARYGTGGNNQPLVMQAFGICGKNSEGMLSSNPEVGFYKADTSRTLDTRGGDPSCNQGGIAVVVPKTLKIRCGKEGGGKGALIQNDLSATLLCNKDQTLFEPIWCANKASYFTAADINLAGPLVATDYKDPPLVNEGEYTVRRLTPTECARLQGFPDWWCDDLGTESPAYGEIDFWKEVFETHRRIVTHATNPKTEKQILKWLKDPHTDAAEYRMWGNGVALPCVVFVLCGIVYYAQHGAE